MTLEELEQQRAAMLDDDALPATTTRAKLMQHQQRRATLDRRLSTARNALAALAALGDDAADLAWQDFQMQARARLCAERLEIKSPIRDKETMGRAINLELSIKGIDFGLGRALKDSVYELSTLRLGELMREAGYPQIGADPGRNYVGQMPWFGSLPEVEQRIAERERRRFQPQSALDDALLDDDVRERREAESKARRDELNARPVRKTRSDGSQYDKFSDGRRVEVTT